MPKIDILKFQKDLESCFKKIKLSKTKNIFITGNLTQISNLRIKKKDKLSAIFNSLKKTLGTGYTIFVPTATLNLCNNNIIFDLKNTPSDKMGPLSEFVRLQNSVRSLHPFWSVSGVGKKARLLKSVSKHAYGYGSPWSKMLDNDFVQVNLGTHPSKAVTLIHHIETIVGVPYRYNKKFLKKIKINNKVFFDDFYQSVFFKKLDVKKRKKLNEHFFNQLREERKLNFTRSASGLDMWTFKMRDFFNVSTKNFTKDIYNYLEHKPNFKKIANY